VDIHPDRAHEFLPAWWTLGRWRAKRHGRIRARSTTGLVAGAARDNVGLVAHRTDGLPCLLLPGKPLGPGGRLYVGSAPRGFLGGVSCRDNGAAYRSRAHRATCQALGIRHSRTRAYRPRTNGKAERFIKTLSEGWAYGAIYGSSAERAAALPSWLRTYNHHRPHGALDRQTPAARLARLLGNNVMAAHN
jgi:hypothetical protein